MKKTFIVAVMALLSGCATTTGGHVSIKPINGTPVPEIGVAPSVQVPDMPSQLKSRATRLPDITDGSLKGVERDGASTDTQYNDLAFRYNAVIDLYDCVKTAVNERDASKMKSCLNK